MQQSCLQCLSLWFDVYLNVLIIEPRQVQHTEDVICIQFCFNAPKTSNWPNILAEVASQVNKIIPLFKGSEWRTVEKASLAAFVQNSWGGKSVCELTINRLLKVFSLASNKRVKSWSWLGDWRSNVTSITRFSLHEVTCCCCCFARILWNVIVWWVAVLVLLPLRRVAFIRFVFWNFVAISVKLRLWLFLLRFQRKFRQLINQLFLWQIP